MAHILILRLFERVTYRFVLHWKEPVCFCSHLIQSIATVFELIDNPRFLVLPTFGASIYADNWGHDG
jgi:hypothetical protein